MIPNLIHVMNNTCTTRLYVTHVVLMYNVLHYVQFNFNDDTSLKDALLEVSTFLFSNQRFLFLFCMPVLLLDKIYIIPSFNFQLDD